MKLETVKKTFVLSVLGLLAACSGPGQRRDPPAPVERGGQVEEATKGDSGGGAQISAYVPPTRPRVVRPAPAKAVQVLIRRADQQRQQGDSSAAVVSLERALRIEPRNATLWNRLARVRAEQGRFAMAEELARKSISLASAYDRELKRDNWQLIASARRAQGDISRAREAERQASRFD